MSKAVTDLTNDHNAILSAFEIFSKMLDKIQQTNSADLDELDEFIAFLKEFADKCHHGKEEGILFPAMIAFGVPDRGGPIGVMMAEHIQGRGLIFDMNEILEDEKPDLLRFEKSGRQYIELLRAHIHKENDVLFPLAERIIPEKDLDAMHLAFEEHEEKVIGAGRHAELHAQLDELKKKYS